MKFFSGSAEQHAQNAADRPLKARRQSSGKECADSSAVQPADDSEGDPLASRTSRSFREPPDLRLFIHFLPRGDLAAGKVSAVCEAWLQAYREQAWRYMILNAGTIEDASARHADHILAPHASVQRFVSAPRQV